MKIFTSKKQKIGKIGEDFAEMFLVKQGFIILDKNFSTKFGEIDLICRKNNRYYFFEVKTITVSHETLNNIKLVDIDNNTYNHKKVSHETKNHSFANKKVVSRETFLKENRKLGNPFENVSFFKIKRLIKTAEIYLQQKRVSHETRWQIDGIGVYLDEHTNIPLFERLENISIR